MSSEDERSRTGDENNGDDGSSQDAKMVQVQVESPPECIDLASDDSNDQKRSDDNTEDEEADIGDDEQSQGDVDMEKPAPLEKSILEELEKESAKVVKASKVRVSSKKIESPEPESGELTPESQASVDTVDLGKDTVDLAKDNVDLADLLGKTSTKKRKLPTSRAVQSDSPMKTPKLEAVATPAPAVKKSAEKPKTEAPDIMIQVGKEKRPTCSSYLINHSGQFRFLLPSGRNTTGLQRLDLKLQDPSVLGLFVKKIKESSLTLTFEEAKRLLQPAVQYKMNIIKEKCIYVIMDNVTPENWIHLKFLAIEAASEDLIRIMDDWLKSDFKSCKHVILKSKQFLGMPMQQLAKLLLKQNMTVSDSMNLIVHELVEGWLSHDKRLQNQSIFSQIKTFELLRTEEYLSNSIFDKKPSLDLPMLELDTPGWVFLQSIVTPKQLINSFKSLEISLNRVGKAVKAEAAPLSSGPPAEERLNNRKRVAEQMEMENEVKRRPVSSALARVDGPPSTPGGGSLPRIPKLNRTSNEDDLNKSWDPMGNVSKGNNTSNGQSGRNGYGEEATTPRGRGSGWGGASRAEPGLGRNMSRSQDFGRSDAGGDWGSSPAKAPARTNASNEENWDDVPASGGGGGGSQTQSSSGWGSTTNNAGFGGSSNFGVGRGRPRNDDNGPDSLSPWDSSARPWKTRGGADDNNKRRSSFNTSANNNDDWGAPVAPANNNSRGNNDDDWGTPKSSNNKSDGGGWGAPAAPSSNSKDDDDGWGNTKSSNSKSDGGGWGNPPASSSYGDSRRDSGSSWGGGGGGNRRDSFGDSDNRRGGRGGGRGGRGGGGGPREPRPGDWACPSCNFSPNFGFKTECHRCQAARPEGLGTSGGDRGGRGGRGGGRGRGGRGGGFSRGGDDSFGGSSSNNTSSYSGWGGGTSSTTAADDDDWGTGSSSSAAAKPAIKPLMDDNWDDDPPAAAAPKPPPPKPSGGDDNWDDDPPPRAAPRPPPPKPSGGDDNWDDDPPPRAAPKPPPPKPAAGGDNWDDDPPPRAAPKPPPPKPSGGDDNWDDDPPPRAAPKQPPTRSAPRGVDWNDGTPSSAPSAPKPSTTNDDDWGDEAPAKVSKPAPAPKSAAASKNNFKKQDDDDWGNEDVAPPETSRAAPSSSVDNDWDDEPSNMKPASTADADDLWNEAVSKKNNSTQAPQKLSNGIPANPRSSMDYEAAARRSLTPLPDPRRSRTSSLEPASLPDPRLSRNSSLEPAAGGDIPVEAFERGLSVAAPPQQASDPFPVVVPEPPEKLPWNVTLAPISDVRPRPGLVEDEGALTQFPAAATPPADPKAIPLDNLKSGQDQNGVSDPRKNRRTPSLPSVVAQNPGSSPDNDSVDQDREGNNTVVAPPPPSSATQPPTPPNVDDDSGWD